MKRNIVFLILILFLGGVLRLWQLGEIPSSLDWDEASLSYNAYSILNTGKDEFGKTLPVVIKSLDDYKPALYSYVSIPFIYVFGLEPFSARLPSALFGLLTIFAVYLLVKELFKSEKLAITTSFFLAISPWHIHFSRIAFESNLGLSLTIFSLLFFIKGIKDGKLLLLSSLFASLTLYTYQAEKILVPLFATLAILIFRKEILSLSRKYIIGSILIGLVVSLPIVVFTFTNPQSFSRASSTSVFANPNYFSDQQNAKRIQVDKENSDFFGLIIDNRRVGMAKELIANYLWHYDLNWLFVVGDRVSGISNHQRHQSPSMGNLYLFELPLFLMGIYLLIFGKFDKKVKMFILGWFLIAPIPSALTYEVPSSVRTLSFLPTFQIFIALGALYVYEKLINRKYLKLMLIGFIGVGIFNIIYFLNQYFVQYNYFASQDWNFGYSQLVPKVEELKNDYENVIVSTKVPLDRSYIFFLFYLKYPPASYQAELNENKDFDKYKFRELASIYSREENDLYVLGESELSELGKQNFNILEIVNYENNVPAYFIVENKK